MCLKVKVKVTPLCLTVCDPMDNTIHGMLQAIPFPAYLPDLGIEPGSPALQVDSLPTELSGKPRSMCLSLTSATLSYSMSWASQVAQW